MRVHGKLQNPKTLESLWKLGRETKPKIRTSSGGWGRSKNVNTQERAQEMAVVYVKL